MCRFARTAVARVSDDYYPRDPASSTPHIGACAYNSLYLGALVQPDWDMFQSAHPAGEQRKGKQGAADGFGGVLCTALTWCGAVLEELVVKLMVYRMGSVSCA